MKQELTKEQKKHLKSIQWLYTGPRQSGRSTLLAYVLIDTVLKTGQEIRIIDHYSSRMADKMLAGIIQSIIETDELPLEISNISLSLKPKLTNK